MAPNLSATDAISAEGQVVEILEKANERRAKVLLKSGTVLDITVGRGADVHLGDEVEIEGAVTLRSIRARVDTAES